MMNSDVIDRPLRPITSNISTVTTRTIKKIRVYCQESKKFRRLHKITESARPF